MTYDTIFCGNLTKNNEILIQQKKVMETMTDDQERASCTK